MNRSICEMLAENLEQSWQSLTNAKANAKKIGREHRCISGKRQKEFEPPDSKNAKIMFELVKDEKNLDRAESLSVNCEGEAPKLEITNVCASENGGNFSESIPSSIHSNQNLPTTTQLQTPPGAASDHSQPESQTVQSHEGPKIFVSEMFVNQRDVYLELASRFSGKAKTQICETSLELPDVAFSTTSCALVFSNSELWGNIQVRLTDLVLKTTA